MQVNARHDRGVDVDRDQRPICAHASPPASAQARSRALARALRIALRARGRVCGQRGDQPGDHRAGGDRPGQFRLASCVQSRRSFCGNEGRAKATFAEQQQA